MKKFAVYMMLVLMTVLVVSCDSMSFDVEPSGYQGLDGLATCLDIYLTPERDNFCSSDDLALEFENYLLYFNDKLDFVEETLSINLGQSITSSSSDSLLTVTINVEVNDGFSSENYDASELIFLQMIQETDEVTKQFTSIRLNLDYAEETSLEFSGMFNGSRDENRVYRTFMAIDQTKTISEIYTDFIDEYIVDNDGEPFTSTVLNLESTNTYCWLNINHVDKEFEYVSTDAEFSSADFKTLIESLLPDYEFIEWVDPYAKI